LAVKLTVFLGLGDPDGQPQCRSAKQSRPSLLMDGSHGLLRRAHSVSSMYQTGGSTSIIISMQHAAGKHVVGP